MPNLWIWVSIGVALVMLAVDAIIIAGPNPRKWKGGKKK